MLHPRQPRAIKWCGSASGKGLKRRRLTALDCTVFSYFPTFGENSLSGPNCATSSQKLCFAEMSANQSGDATNSATSAPKIQSSSVDSAGNSTDNAPLPPVEKPMSDNDSRGSPIAPGVECILSGLTTRTKLNNQRCVVVRRQQSRTTKNKKKKSQTWVVKLSTNNKHIAVGAHRLIVIQENCPPPQKITGTDQVRDDAKIQATHSGSESTTTSTSSTSTAPSLPPSKMITVGTNCILRGLHRRTDLNGSRCVAVKRSKTNPEKWVVQIVGNHKCVAASENNLEVIGQDYRFSGSNETSTATAVAEPTPDRQNIFVRLKSFIAAASDDQIQQWKEQVNTLEDVDYQNGCPTQGISYRLLSDLGQFVNRHHPEWYTYDFCDKYVKPITAQFCCSLLNLLKVVVPTTGIKHLGVVSKQATIFVSHAWSYRSRRLLSCLSELEDSENDFFWIDTLTVRQHKHPSYPDRGFKWWCNTFQKSVEVIGRTVLVLLPYTDPVPLKRSWCLFEIFCSHNAKDVRFDILLGREERKAFERALATTGFNPNDWVSKIDLATAKATKQVDQDNILAQVNSTPGGIARLNEIVTGMLREWFATTGSTLAASVDTTSAPDTEQALKTQMEIANMLARQGKLVKAEALMRKVLHQSTLLLGESHVDTLGILSNLSNVLAEQGKYSEAESKCRKAMTDLEVQLGDNHDYTLKAANALGTVLQCQERFAEAEAVYRKLLPLRTANFGADDRDTLALMQNLATVLELQNKFDDAETLYLTALAGWKAKFGEGHPQTLQTVMNYAGLLSKQGKWADAEKLERQVVAARRVKLGRQHQHYLSALYNLATTLGTQGKLREAEEILREAVIGRQAKFGDNNADTANAKVKLAAILAEQGKLKEAETLARQGQIVYQSTFGNDHAKTLKVSGVLEQIHALAKSLK